MRRILLGTLVAAGLFFTRLILLALGLFIRRMDGSYATEATAHRGTNGHARPAPSA